MFCTQCGAPLDETMKFCTSCGAAVSGAAADATATTSAAAPEAPVVEEVDITALDAATAGASTGDAAMAGTAADDTAAASAAAADATATTSAATPDAPAIDAADVTAQVTPAQPARSKLAAPITQPAPAVDVTAQMPPTPAGQSAPAAPTTQAAQSTAQMPPASKVQTSQATANAQPGASGKNTRVIVAIVIAALAACAIAFGLVLFFLGDGGSNSEAEETAVSEVYYSADDAVDVSAESEIIPYSKEGKPLEDYSVRLMNKESKDWNIPSIDVEGTGGFRLSHFGTLDAGTYSVEIIDNETNETYYGPAMVLAESTDGSDGSESDDAQSTSETDASGEDAADVIELWPDPDDPESATEPNEVEYSFTTESLEVSYTGDGVYTSDFESTWTYPQFTSNVESEALDAFNESIVEEVQELYEETLGWDWQTAEDSQCVEFDATVMYLEGSLVSIRIEEYITNWGAHGSTVVTGQLYDLETGEEVTLEEATGLTNGEIQTAAVSALETYLEAYPSDIYDAADLAETLDSIAATEDRYYLCSAGLIVVTGDYELGSFAYGQCEVVAVSYDDAYEVGVGIAAEDFVLEDNTVSVVTADDDADNDADEGTDDSDSADSDDEADESDDADDSDTDDEDDGDEDGDGGGDGDTDSEDDA